MWSKISNDVTHFIHIAMYINTFNEMGGKKATVHNAIYSYHAFRVREIFNWFKAIKRLFCAELIIKLNDFNLPLTTAQFHTVTYRFNVYLMNILCLYEKIAINDEQCKVHRARYSAETDTHTLTLSSHHLTNQWSYFDD